MTDEEKREVWVKVQDNAIHKVYVCTEHPYGVLVEDWVSGIPLHYNVPYCNILTAKAPDEQVRELQTENAALRERLEKAIEPPCECDDIFYRFFQYPAEMVEDIACGFRKEKDGELYVCSANSESWYNVKECEFSREAAEARLKELQGGEE